MAQELLPQGLNLSRDTHDLILSFAHEFLHLITFQANEICQNETNNGYIGLQHVVRACQELGFQEYVGEIVEVGEVYDRELKVLQKVRSPGGSGKKEGERGRRFLGCMLMVEEEAEDWVVG